MTIGKSTIYGRVITLRLPHQFQVRINKGQPCESEKKEESMWEVTALVNDTDITFNILPLEQETQEIPNMMHCFHCGESDTHVTDGNGLCYNCSADHPEGSDAPHYYCPSCGGTTHLGCCLICHVFVEEYTCTCKKEERRSTHNALV